MTVGRDELLRYLESELGVEISHLRDDAPLFSSGLIDSFSMVVLIQFLEERSNRMIPVAEITFENIDTVERILAFVAARSGPGSDQ